MAQTLDELLHGLERQLLDIGRSLHMLEAFTRELNLRCRGKKFDVQNDPVWRMVFNARDMFVIDLAGFAKGAIESRLFNQLRAHHARAFKPKRRRGDDESRSRAERFDEHHAAAYGRIFDPTKKAPPNAEAFDGMKDLFDVGTAWVRDDRSLNRAHRYEKTQPSGRDVLDTLKLRGAYDFVTGFVNDISLVGLSSTTSFHNMNVFPVGRVAEGLVDDVLLGLRFAVTVDRDGLYSAMHATHRGDNSESDDDESDGDEPYDESAVFNRRPGREAMRLFLKGSRGGHDDD